MNMRKRKAAAATVVALAAAVTLAAAGYATTSSSGDDSPSTPAPAVAAASEANVDNASVTSSALTGKARGYTTVTFTEGAVEALAPLNPKGDKPGAFGLSPSGLAVEAAFPIVGNAAGGVINHVGGLTFSDGDNALTLRGYRIDTTTGKLTATAKIKGERPTTIDFLNVTPTAPASGCDVSATLTLAPTAATALSFVFGAPDLTGATIGTACVTLR